MFFFIKKEVACSLALSMPLLCIQCSFNEGKLLHIWKIECLIPLRKSTGALDKIVEYRSFRLTFVNFM